MSDSELAGELEDLLSQYYNNQLLDNQLKVYVKNLVSD